MRFDELHKVLHKSPFQPFRIQLTNGESWLIRHPDFAALTRTSVYVGVSSGHDEIPDMFNQYDLLHVVGVKPVKHRPLKSRGKRHRGPSR